MGQMWTALQEDLARESPGSRHVIAEESGHNIQADEPELVIQVIRELVMRARRDGGESRSGSDSDR
jgi:pimeloyl-ACP methyl ester carboxylesterase